MRIETKMRTYLSMYNTLSSISENVKKEFLSDILVSLFSKFSHHSITHYIIHILSIATLLLLPLCVDIITYLFTSSVLTKCRCTYTYCMVFRIPYTAYREYREVGVV